MGVYWFLFAIPAFATLFEKAAKKKFRGEKVLFASAAIIFFFVIGLRYEVGADWFNYIGAFIRAEYLAFDEIPASGDPGYVFFNWVASHSGGDVWWVNLGCAAGFAYGLYIFARSQPRPWLALCVSVPYLVTVVAMGYTRQGVALGLAMVGLVALGQQRSTARFVFWVVCAAAFHKSAVLLIPIAALANDRGRLWTATWIAGATIMAYFTLLEDSVDTLMYTYVESEYQSDGAFIRIAMNALPAIVFLIFRAKFFMPLYEKRLWIVLSSLALLMVPVLLLTPSSTAVDRIALYLIPLQLMVWSRVPDTFAYSERSSRFLGIGIVAYSAAVQFVWLNFASHADAWLPYQLYPL